MKKKSMILLSILAILFLSGCEERSEDTRQVLKEEPADETILSKIEEERSNENVSNKEISEDNPKIDNNTSLSIPPDLLDVNRKRVVPKSLPSMPPELIGVKRKVEENKTIPLLGPDGIELSEMKRPEEITLPPELIEKEKNK